MKNKLTFFTLLVSAALMVGLGVGRALAFPGETTPDNFTQPNTVFTAPLKTGEVATFSANFDGDAVVITCKVATLRGTTPATGLGPFALNGVNGAVFDKCKWSLNGGEIGDADINTKLGGPWMFTVVDNLNEIQNGVDVETYGANDMVQVILPAKGAQIILRKGNGVECTIIANPQTVVATTFNDKKGEIIFTKANVGFSAQGGVCGNQPGNGMFSATLVADYAFNKGKLSDTA